MTEVRWWRGSEPLLVAIASILALLVGAAPAQAAETAGSSGPAAVCAAGSSGQPGTWYRRLADADPRGWLRGHTLLAGRPDGTRTARVRLPAESFVAPPVRGLVVYGSDDGARSEVRILRVADGCDTRLLRSEDVVRRATLDPTGSIVYLHRVERHTRADRGIWRRAIDGSDGAAQVMPGLADPADGPFGRTYLTLFTWSGTGRTLAVQSCGADACRTRLLDTASGMVRLDASPGQGELIGVTDTARVGYRGDCHGLPCDIEAIGTDGSRRTLVRSAGVAAFADGRLWYERQNGGRSVQLRYVDPAGRHDHGVDVDSRRIALPARWADAAVELPDGWLALTPDGRWTAPAELALARLKTDRTLRRATIQEVTR